MFMKNKKLYNDYKSFEYNFGIGKVLKIVRLFFFMLIMIHLTGCLFTVNNIKKLDKGEKAYGISATVPVLSNINEEKKFTSDLMYKEIFTDEYWNEARLSGLNLTLLFMQKYINNNLDYGIIYYITQASLVNFGSFILYNLYKNNSFEINSILEMDALLMYAEFPFTDEMFIGFSPEIKIAVLRKISKKLYSTFDISFRYSPGAMIIFTATPEFLRLTPNCGIIYKLNDFEYSLSLSSDIYKANTYGNNFASYRDDSISININLGLKYRFSIEKEKSCCGCVKSLL